MSSLAESLTALPAVVSMPVTFHEGVDVLQSPDSLNRHSKGHFLNAEENVSLELGDWLNSKGFKGAMEFKGIWERWVPGILNISLSVVRDDFFMAYHMSLRPLLCIL